jgi:regulator of sigma E protease
VLNPVSLIVSIVALGFLIVVHEGGHYFVARWCRMRIDLFSIGFGPGLLKRTSKKTGTTFQLAPIPFGGFVQIRGMNIAEEVDPEDQLAYPNRPVWQRFITIFAGPATNYLSAIVLALLLYSCHGVDVARWYGVDSVLKDYDAYGKLERGDRIVAIDHQPLTWGDGTQLVRRVTESGGAPLTLTIERKGQSREVVLQPHLDKDAGSGKMIWRIGVQPYAQTVTQSVGMVAAARMAIQFPIDESRWIGKELYGIVFGSEKADPGGPVRMVEEFYHAFSAGVAHGIILLMRLSVYLGLFNLLPIPALDGGRLVFLVYEMVTRRRANPKVETMVHMTGIMALGVVMILVLFVDIKRFF